jgi:hypothetical protein
MWQMEKYQIPINPKNIYLAQDKNEKIRNILNFLNENPTKVKKDYQRDVKIHIDDDLKILKKLSEEDSKRGKEDDNLPVHEVWLFNKYNNPEGFEKFKTESYYDKKAREGRNEPQKKESLNVARWWGEVPSLVKTIKDTSFRAGELGSHY